jgi:hypothetical protein
MWHPAPFSPTVTFYTTWPPPPIRSTVPRSPQCSRDTPLHQSPSLLFILTHPHHGHSNGRRPANTRRGDQGGRYDWGQEAALRSEEGRSVERIETGRDGSRRWAEVTGASVSTRLISDHALLPSLPSLSGYVVRGRAVKRCSSNADSSSGTQWRFGLGVSGLRSRRDGWCFSPALLLVFLVVWRKSRGILDRAA